MSLAHPLSVALALLALAPAAPLVAQAPAPDAVPRELALALANADAGPPGHRPELLLGRAPHDFPAAVLPSGAAVLGSLVRWGRTTVVLTSPLAEPRELEQRWADGLVQAGWKPSMPGMNGGFVGQAPSIPARQLRTFCRSGAHLHISARPREAGGSLLRAELDADAGPMRCGGSAPAPAGRPAMAPPPMPELRAPAGAAPGGGGSTASSEGSWSTYQMVGTDLSPAALVAHYRAGLERQGWAGIGVPSEGEGMAAQRFSFRDAEGRLWHGVLSAVTLPVLPERQVSFSAVREDARLRRGAR